MIYFFSLTAANASTIEVSTGLHTFPTVLYFVIVVDIYSKIDCYHCQVFCHLTSIYHRHVGQKIYTPIEQG